MDNGITCETIRRGQSYYGRIAVYEHGVRLWSEESPIARLSRGDAMRDAQQMAHDLKVTQFLAEAS